MTQESLDLLLHPAEYVRERAIRITRSLQALGGLLLVIALVALARQAFQDFPR